MNNAKKLIILIIICINLIIQSGCWDQRIYEKIGFILQLGLEYDEQGKLRYTVTIPVTAPDIKGQAEVLSTSPVNLLREGREKLRNSAGRILEGGKIQHLYFSKELAQSGINEFLEVFFRNPENPILSNILIVDGSPKEMMIFGTQFENKPRSAIYVNALLEDARSIGHTPETRIYKFSILNYSKTIDPVTPIVKYNDKQIEITGSALFSGDKMVGQINTDKSMLLNMLMNKKKNIQYIYKGQRQGDEKVKSGDAIFIQAYKRKISIDVDEEKPTINIKMNLDGSLVEDSWEHNLYKPQEQKEIEEIIAKTIQKDYLELLKYLQQVGSDPIGFGEMIRVKHNKYWKSIKWKNVYKDVKFNVEAKLNIESYGVIY